MRIKAIFVKHHYKAHIIKYCYRNSSYENASRSEITPCNKIDKPLVVYRFAGNIHNNVAYIMTKLCRFYGRNEISIISNLNFI